MKYRIDGKIMETITVELNDGEALWAESGGMVWMSDNMDMKTEMRGGLGAGIGRMFSGESLFLVKYTAQGKGVITFANETPGKIMVLDLKAGQEMICEKDAFLCAEESVSLQVHFRKKFGVGLFGGEGFILQKLTGPGTVAINFSGEITEFTLKAGEKLRVDTGVLAMMEPTVKFEIEMVKGVKNMIFGGEGLFLGTLEGPGKVWLQSMPVSTLASKIRQYIPGR